MSHGCPADTINLFALGCYESWAQFFTFVGIAFGLTVLIGAVVLLHARYQRGR